MNKYDELIQRAQRFPEPIIGELINAVRELKDREEVVHCRDCRYGKKSRIEGYLMCAALTNPNFVLKEHFCSYGERKEDA